MPTLDYSGPGASEGANAAFRRRALLLTCVVLTGFAALTCLRIEVLNARAGGVLPRDEPGIWRVGYWTNEPSWRMVESRRTGDATLTARPLTAAERAQMVRETTRNRAEADLRDLVGTFGCSQYVLVPLASFLSLTLLCSGGSHHRRLGGVCLIVALLCGGLMFYRAYWTSLGWMKLLLVALDRRSTPGKTGALMNPLLPMRCLLMLGLAMCLTGCRGNETARPAEREGGQATLPDDAPKSFRVYVGTYTGPKSKGIYLYDFDVATGALTPVGLAAETANPSFLALSPDAGHLYAVGEIDSFESKKTGAVSAFAVEPSSGMLSLLNQQPSGGGGPCHVSTDSTGRFVFVANYGGGSVASFPVGPDGKLGEAASVIQHEGTGVDPSRQEGPHGHWIGPSPDDKYVLACDLGLDKVVVYTLDQSTGKLTAFDPEADDFFSPSIRLPLGSVAPGAGPRHAAFGPDGEFLYVINEMGNTMTAFAWGAANGRLDEIQTIATLPGGYKETSSTAEVVVHPSGRFVYGSNRGHDSIVAYAADPSSAELTLIGHATAGIKTPRNFNIDPTGQWLIVANQDADSLAVFKIDANTGALTPTGEPVPAPTPVCVTFAPAGKKKTIGHG